MATATITNMDDLRKVYEAVFDGFGVDVSDVTDKKINTRYARELLGTLVTAGLVVVTDVNGDGDVWQTAQTHDEISKEEAMAKFDAWAGNVPTEEKPPRVPKARNQSPCLCGCGELSANHYRPGHDARHAGMIGRKIAENYNTKGFDRRELLNELPSEALVAKAEGIAEKAIEKMEARAKREVEREARKTAPTYEEGTVKVGKNEKVGRRAKDGTVEYLDDKGEWKPASKSASATFAA